MVGGREGGLGIYFFKLGAIIAIESIIFLTNIKCNEYKLGNFYVYFYIYVFPFLDLNLRFHFCYIYEDSKFKISLIQSLKNRFSNQSILLVNLYRKKYCNLHLKKRFYRVFLAL